MKKLISIAISCGVIAASLQAETLFGPGTINIGTNEAILINSAGFPGSYFRFYLDGIEVGHYTAFDENPRFAVAGPRILTITNSSTFVTFQRLRGSSIQTVITNPSLTNTINVPSEKTIQFFARIGDSDVVVDVFPPNSTNVYSLLKSNEETHPSLTGPARIEARSGSGPAVISYYLTDEVLQLPPEGLLLLPASQLEVHIEKSFDLTNWVKTAVFSTEAEAKAFYRLRMLK